MKSLASPLPRILAHPLERALRTFPVVVLTGARQTGKTTLVESAPLRRGRTLHTLDDLEVLERALKRPGELIEGEAPVTLDEVQRAPDLLLAIKRSVDRRRIAGRFLLTGSANLLLMRRVSESLAGRAVYLHLHPMTESEKAGRPGVGPWSRLLHARTLEQARASIPREGRAFQDWPQRVSTGGFPASVLAAGPRERSAWFDGYLRTYLERDLRDLASISALPDFNRLMRLSALRIGQVLNQSALTRDAGLSQPTAHRYLNLLETSLQISRIPAYKVSRTARLVKSPRLYWNDAGLGAHLAGLRTAEAVKSAPLGGSLLENLVLTHLLAWRETLSPPPDLLYWRTRGGDEVDFVIEQGRRILPVEIKGADRVRPDDLRGLNLFLDEYGPAHAPFGVLLYSGRETLAVTDRILAVPLSSALGLD